MDLSLYFRVLWRFRLVVVIGTMLACVLAVLSIARISFEGGTPDVQYRQALQWSSSTTLFLTEPGFPEGYRSPPQRFANPDRYSQLAFLYSNFIGSDSVQTSIRRMGVRRAGVSASTVSSRESGALPFVIVTSFAPTPQEAIHAAAVGARALQDYVIAGQTGNNVTVRDRVVLEVLRRPQTVELLAGRKKTTAIAIFLTVMMATFGLAFVLENLRPRVRVLESDTSADRRVAAATRE